MTVASLIPAISSSILTSLFFGGVIWLSRKWISERLGRSIQHEYDQKLTVLKASLASDLEKLRSETVKYESEVKSLREGALSNLTQREAILFKKRVEAIECIWAAKQKLDKGLFLATTIGVINWERVGENDPPSEALSEIADLYLRSGSNLADLGSDNLQTCKLYVSSLLWARFEAYQAIIIDAYARMTLLQKKQPLSLLNTDGVTDLLKKAIPECTQVIDEYGVSIFSSLLKALGEKLLIEMRAELNSSEPDEVTLRKAADIIADAQKLNPIKLPKIPEEFRQSPPPK